MIRYAVACTKNLIGRNNFYCTPFRGEIIPFLKEGTISRVHLYPLVKNYPKINTQFSPDMYLQTEIPRNLPLPCLSPPNIGLHFFLFSTVIFLLKKIIKYWKLNFILRFYPGIQHRTSSEIFEFQNPQKDVSENTSL